MPIREYKPRLSVELTEAQDHALRMLVPHNMKSPVVRAMLDMLIHLLKTLPNARLQILTLIVTKEFDLAQATYQKVLGEGEDELRVLCGGEIEGSAE
jgi:hypothetical protein